MRINITKLYDTLPNKFEFRNQQPTSKTGKQEFSTTSLSPKVYYIPLENEYERKLPDKEDKDARKTAF